MADGKIRLDATALIAAYPTHRNLPATMQRHFDSLNAPIRARNKIAEEWNKDHPGDTPKKLEGEHTSCCFQISYALNTIGGTHAVGPRSQRRANQPLEGKFHLGAVDELEWYLNDKYGLGDVVKTDKRSTRPAMEAYLDGKQGILAFRQGLYGEHTEIWDKTRVLQNGAPIGNGNTGVGMMDQGWMWGRQNIVFWEVIPDTPAVVAKIVGPAWLEGWWEVIDLAKKYYYYFYRDGSAIYTMNKPQFNYCPISTDTNSGIFEMLPPNKLRIDWKDGDHADEVFSYPSGPLEQAPVMAGTYEGVASLPFKAVKLF